MASLPPRTIGQYEIVRKLGAGGMGEVYLAVHAKTRRKVALKLLPPHLTADEQRVRRFEQESRAVLALNHPNIVTVYDIGEADGAHFIANELIEGETLRQRLRRGRLAVPEALDVSIQVACALDAAHQAGVVHRDIKPENVMLRRDGYVKVLDFGIAKLAENAAAVTPAESEATTRALVKTEAGIVLGTVSYMSPEQARGRAVDARTDVWSLGVMLYEMLAGRRPFEGETPNHVVVSITEKEPAPLSRRGVEAPEELERIASKALAKDRDERYQTAKDLLIDLRRLKKRLEVEAEIERSTPPESGERKASGGARESAGTTSADEAARRTQTAGGRPTAGLKSRRGRALVAFAALALVSAVVFYFFKDGFGGGKTIDSIAVLPLVNTGGDPDTEYLSDGLTESIINSLSQLSGLKVMSRNSVFRYKGREADAQEVGRALGVRAVLAGRVVQRGDGLSIKVELVDARDNAHVWGAQYDRKLTDILAVQGEIAREISEQLRPKLTGEERKLLNKRSTEDTEAYRLYLKGDHFWHKFTPDAERTAAEYFNQAIAKDPRFVLAYEGLARSYSVMANNSWMRPHDAYPKAKAAVAKALEIEPDNAKLHNSLVAYLMFYDWDWAGSEREFKRAIELDGDYWHHHELYAYLLSALGRTDEAIAEIRRAQEIDPLSLIGYGSGASMFYRARQYDRAVEQARKALELDTGWALAHQTLGSIYVQQGKYEEAIAEFEQTIRLSGSSPNLLAALGHAFAVSGRRDEALKRLAELKELSRRSYVSPHDMAILYTGLGDKEQAFAHLEKAYEERNAWMMFLKVDPVFDPLRSDPRFAALLRRMKLAP